METLYAPFFATENCLLGRAGALAGITLLGVVASGVFWLALWKYPHRPTLLRTLGAGAAMFFVFGAYLVFTIEETMVRVATDWSVIEHRTCRGTRLAVDRHPIEDAQFRYRRDVRENVNNPALERVSHYLDIVVPEREEPISISLDAGRSEIDLEKVRRLAPGAVASYEASR